MRAILPILALLAGCTVDGSVDLETSPAMTECTDTRDGERFSFRAVNVTNVRAGLGGADTCFDVRDEDGRQRTLCGRQEAYLKCVPTTPTTHQEGARRE